MTCESASTKQQLFSRVLKRDMLLPDFALAIDPELGELCLRETDV